MKLSDLQKKISPLPWRPYEIARDVRQELLDEQYKTHAANTLPALVEALRSLADEDGKFHNWENAEGEFLDDKLNAALAAAEEVKEP